MIVFIMDFWHGLTIGAFRAQAQYMRFGYSKVSTELKVNGSLTGRLIR